MVPHSNLDLSIVPVHGIYSSCFFSCGVTYVISLYTISTAAVSNARKEQTGLASGLVDTSYRIGSALGLAIMVAFTSGQTEHLHNNGTEQVNALNGVFHVTFICAGLIS